VPERRVGFSGLKLLRTSSTWDLD